MLRDLYSRVNPAPNPSSVDTRPAVTRLAPSPTGALHLGNMRTFVINWTLAQQQGWQVVMRIEDLDGPRVKPGTKESMLNTLHWIGIDWEPEILTQSDHLGPYAQAMQHLAQNECVYTCDMTRREIEAAASAPHAGDDEHCYPAHLRSTSLPTTFHDRNANWRFVPPVQPIVFNDAFGGRKETCPATQVGDFVVWTKRGQPSYQLAVVVDDERQCVTHIVRGDDLIDSTGRQIAIQQMLEYSTDTTYFHVPLIVGPDGKRLAKRHGDTRVGHYQKMGVPAERIIGLLAFWCRTIEKREPLSLPEFVDAFDLATLPRSATTCTADDDHWLRYGNE